MGGSAGGRDRVMAVQPHQARVLVERAELADRIEELRGFVRGPVFALLAVEERSRLLRQCGLMTLYLEVLDERIAAFLPSGASG